MTNEDLPARLRQLANNTGKMTWVGDLPMPATAVLHLSADAIERLEAENARLREGLEWSLAEIDGRTRYVSNCDYTAKEQRNNAYDLARAALEKHHD